MASLNDLLGRAKIPTASSLAKDIRGQVSTSIKATSNEIRNIPGQIAQAGISQARGAVSGAVTSGLTSLKSATAQALTGDFSGALSTLSMGPSEALGKFGAAFGLGSGGGTLGQNGGVTNTLQGALARTDPMLSFQWFCELPTITPVGGRPTVLDWSYVEEANVPFRTYDTRQVYAQGRNRKFASTYSLDNLRLNFYADISNKSMQYLLAWDGAILVPFSASQAPSGGGFGRPSDYQKPIRIYLVDSARSVVLMLEYTEAWPTNIDALQLDSGTSTRLTFNVNFNVGDVFITAFGVNANLSGQALLQSFVSGSIKSAANTAFNAVRSLI